MDTGTLADRVYDILRERILQGVYAPGTKLNLARLARDLQVSNTPVREAMARLERVGLVDVKPYSGPTVRKLTATQVADIWDVRIALEELAARQASERRDPETLKHMHTTLDAQAALLEADADTQARRNADRAFHDALVQASGNSVLIEMLPTLSDRTRLLMQLSSVDASAAPAQHLSNRGLRGHQRILSAIEAGDGDEAVAALQDELGSAKDRLLARMASDQPET